MLNPFWACFIGEKPIFEKVGTVNCRLVYPYNPVLIGNSVSSRSKNAKSSSFGSDSVLQ